MNNNLSKSTSLEILGWSAYGLRCPDYSISFEKNNGIVYPVSLIQMPNGTGKTTTLSLLRAALSGSAKNWDYNDVMSFQKRSTPINHGEFKVSLKHNGSLLTFSMIFDFEEGRVQYYTTTGSDQYNTSFGKQPGFRPPAELKDVLHPNFINFFVFDGELAQQLLDPNFSNAEKAIENLYQLKYFHEILGVIRAYWNRKMESSTATEQKGYTRRKQKVAYLTERIRQLK